MESEPRIVPVAPCTLCTIPVTIPAGITFSTQAVILDIVCGTLAVHLLPTQAYDVAT